MFDPERSHQVFCRTNRLLAVPGDSFVNRDRYKPDVALATKEPVEKVQEGGAVLATA